MLQCWAIDNKKKFFLKFYNIKGSLKKELIKPFPAKYHKEFLDPLSNEDPIISYIKTDETGKSITLTIEGYVEFNETYFSVYGPIDEYKITFWCMYSRITTDYIKVLTTVSRVQYFKQPESLLNIKVNASLTLTCAVAILDKSLLGI